MSTHHLLRRLSATSLALVVGALVLLGPLGRPASAAGPVPSADTDFVNLLNTLRGTLGLPTLRLDSQASGVAQAWSQNMARTGTLSHNPNPSNQISSWSKLGENVGTEDAVALIFSALVASPPHMRNMSDGGFNDRRRQRPRRERSPLDHPRVRARRLGGAPRPAGRAGDHPGPGPGHHQGGAEAQAHRSSHRRPGPRCHPGRPGSTAPSTTTPPATAPPPRVAPTPPSSMATLPVEAARGASPTASAPPLPPLAPVSSTSEKGPIPGLALAALVGLAGLAGAGFLAHRQPLTRAHRPGALRVGPSGAR